MSDDICKDCGDLECCVPIALGDDEPIAYSQCLERQLIAQAALLRSVTGKLEEAHEMLDGAIPNDRDVQLVLESVLEVLS